MKLPRSLFIIKESFNQAVGRDLRLSRVDVSDDNDWIFSKPPFAAAVRNLGMHPSSCNNTPKWFIPIVEDLFIIHQRLEAKSNPPNRKSK